MKNIKSVRINFRASTSVKPSLTSTRAGDRIKFYDVQLGSPDDTGTGSGNSGGGGGNGGDGGDDDYTDPDA